MATPPQNTLPAPRRRLAAWAVPVAVLLPLLAAGPAATSAAAADPTEGACAPGQGVTVVVDATEVGGEVETRCAPGDPVDGIQVLEAAGFEIVTQSFGANGEFLCLVDGFGAACDAPFTGSYWAFFTADSAAQWEVAGGASNTLPVPGDVHAWRWGAGEPPAGSAPAPAPVRPGGTGTPDPNATARAAAYLVGRLQDGALPGLDGTPAYDLTTDAAFGLLAASGTDAALDPAIDSVLDVLERDAARYTRGQAFAGERPDAVYAGPTAKLGLLALLTGGDPRSVGGLDLVADLTSTEDVAGRFTDRSDLGDDSNVFTQSFGVLLLEEAADVDPSAEATNLLLAAQCPDGGFPVDLGAAECTSDADATGIALQALAALPDATADVAEARAVTYLFSVQLHGDQEGAFGSTAPGATGANVNTTGYAAMGLAAAGQDVSSAVTWLSSTLQADGGLPVTVTGEPASDAFATAQALPALTARGFVATARAVVRATEPTPTPTEPTPTPTPTEPTPTEPTPTEPSPTQPTVSPTSGQQPTATSGTTVAARGGRLARTGTDPLLPVAVGGGLVAAGAGLLLTTRRTTRRRGAHQ